MRFFSPQWHAGDLTAGEEDAAIARYQDHLAHLLPAFSEDMRTFFQSESLHDALICSVTGSKSAGDLLLELTSGDSNRSYRTLHLDYRGVLSDVYEAIATLPADRPWEILYDEIDREDNLYVHRLLFWPYAELPIKFMGFSFTVEPCFGRYRASLPNIDLRS